MDFVEVNLHRLDTPLHFGRCLVSL